MHGIKDGSAKGGYMAGYATYLGYAYGRVADLDDGVNIDYTLRIAEQLAPTLVVIVNQASKTMSDVFKDVDLLMDQDNVSPLCSQFTTIAAFRSTLKCYVTPRARTSGIDALLDWFLAINTGYVNTLVATTTEAPATGIYQNYIFTYILFGWHG